MTELLATYVSEFRAGFPNVPFAPGVDEAGIKADDPDPMFVTLPLLAVGGKSGNGFTWERPDVNRVVAQINDKKPEGMLGHIKPEERSSKYELGKLRWVGAIIDDKGVAWGKAYVPAYAMETRQYFKLAKRTNARVGTSVYGTRGDKGLSDMDLESVDLGHPDRLGLSMAAAVPHITSEMENSNNDNKSGEDKHPMPENVDSKLVQELINDKVKALTDLSAVTTKLGEKDSLIAEMTKKVNTLDGVEKLVAEFAGNTVAEKIGNLVSELSDLRKATQKTQIDKWIAEAIKAVELEDLRPTIIAQMGDVDSEAKAKARVEELLKRDDIKVIAEALAEKHMGPRAFVGDKGNQRTSLKDLEKPENIASARAWAGF